MLCLISLFFTSVLCFALLIVNKNVSIFLTHLLQDFTHCSHEVNLPAWVSILNHITDPTLSGPNGIHFIQYENIIYNIVNSIRYNFSNTFFLPNTKQQKRRLLASFSLVIFVNQFIRIIVRSHLKRLVDTYRAVELLGFFFVH